MRMNEARLEIVADDLDSSPRLSRSIPAALDGLIDDKAFYEFADELDKLLEILDNGYQQFQNRLQWMQYGYYSIFFGFLLLSQYFIVLYSVYLMTSILYLICIWLFAGPKTSAVIIVREIRSTCEGMTNRTPNVSFHPIFRQVLTYSSPVMETIIYIDVSISNNAFEGEKKVDAVVMNFDDTVGRML